MSMPRFPTPAAFFGDRRTRVIVVGAGGTGSMLLDGLARLDAALRVQGHAGMDVTVYDHDTFSPANFGRQRCSQADAGFNKSVLMVMRLNAFYGLDWTAVPEQYEPTGHYINADLVVGCVDRGLFRHTLGASFADKPSDTLYLDAGNGASTAQVILGHLGNPREGQRLPNVYDLYGDELLAGDESDLPSCSLAEALLRQRWSINPLVADVAMSLLDQLFQRGGLDQHGALINLDPIQVSPIMIDPVVWSSFGYTTSLDAKPRARAHA